jgi:cytochrome c-type biogenesis protein CcmH/NrfG
MSYPMKRLILLVMGWGLLVFIGAQVRENLTAAPPPTPVAQAAQGADPLATPDELTALQDTLDKNPQDVVAMTRLAKLLYDEGDYQSAETLLERAVELAPHDPDLLVQLAAAQFRLAQIDAARDTLLKATALAPDRADIHLLLGLALSRGSTPKPDAAAVEWQKVIQLAPGTDLARQAQELINGTQ